MWLGAKLVIVSNIYSVTREDFRSIAADWGELCWRAASGFPFILPAWMEVWWQNFGQGAQQCLCAMRQRDEVVGIAPLLIRNGEASFIGNCDVCDYLDFVIVEGREMECFGALTSYLTDIGVTSIDLVSLRPDSVTMTKFIEFAGVKGYPVTCTQTDVTYELDLPDTWDVYLRSLKTKQRHELGRKLRRLHEAGTVSFEFIDETSAISGHLDVFLRLFCESRADKAAFMVPVMESFFRSLVNEMGEAGLVRLGILWLDASAVAMVVCFDYQDTIYLYNSGYDPKYRSLSVGLLSKVLSIKDSIEKGKKKYDFLRGSERYKRDLGGKQLPVHECRITLK